MSPQPIDLSLRPVALQGVPAPGYSAVDLRRMALAGQAQEGVIAAGDFKVTQRAAGAGLAVDVAAGEALVQGDSIANQGLYYVLLAAAATGAGELTVRAGDAQPRIDQVVLQILDTQHDGSGLNIARLRIIEGTPTAGATLDNRLGAAALPSSCVRLADYRMIGGGGNVPTAEIRDRRPWARGAHRYIKRNANAAATNDYTTTSTSMVAVDGTNLSPRIESTGMLRLRLMFDGWHSALDAFVRRGFLVDGAMPDAQGDGNFQTQLRGASVEGRHEVSYDVVPAAGSHVVAGAYCVVTPGTFTMLARAPTNPVVLVIDEDVRQNADNN